MIRIGAAGGPSDRNTRSATPVWISRACVAMPAAASPASTPRARTSSRRMSGRAHLLVRLGKALDALLDLGRGDAGVGQPQRGLATLEHEVGALDELDAAAR